MNYPNICGRYRLFHGRAEFYFGGPTAFAAIARARRQKSSRRTDQPDQVHSGQRELPAPCAGDGATEFDASASGVHQPRSERLVRELDRIRQSIGARLFAIAGGRASHRAAIHHVRSSGFTHHRRGCRVGANIFGRRIVGRPRGSRTGNLSFLVALGLAPAEKDTWPPRKRFRLQHWLSRRQGAR